LIELTLDPRGTVRLKTVLDLPLSPSAVWGQMHHFAHFISLDPFHAVIELPDGPPRQGSSIRILHRFTIFRVRRTGRILRWRPGVGYSFSDLSRRGRCRGFPHIFIYRVQPLEAPGRSRLTITVRGLWTARWLPRAAVRFWLHWVLGRTCDTVERQLLSLAAQYPHHHRPPTALSNSEAKPRDGHPLALSSRQKVVQKNPCTDRHIKRIRSLLHRDGQTSLAQVNPPPVEPLGLVAEQDGQTARMARGG